MWAMVAYLVVFGIGLSPMPWTVNSEIYPQRARATCVSIATGVNWSANYLVAATFLSTSKLLSTGTTPSGDPKPDGAFWLYGGIAALGWLWLYGTMPETKGKTLEEIEGLFAGEDDPRERRYSGAAYDRLNNLSAPPG